MTSYLHQNHNSHVSGTISRRDSVHLLAIELQLQVVYTKSISLSSARMCNARGEKSLSQPANSLGVSIMPKCLV